MNEREQCSVHDENSPISLGLYQHKKGMVQESPDSALTMDFIKKERFKFIPSFLDSL